jgi:hypothetical protein
MGRLALDLSGTPCLLDLRAFTARWAFSPAPRPQPPPWTYRRHMDTLRVTTTPPAPICGSTPPPRAAVLAGADLPDDARACAPLALWWAAGGDDALPPPAEGEWLDRPRRPRPPAPVERTPALQRPLRGPRR